MRTHFNIRLPATAANLGPGFDCLGIAMTLHNDFEVRREGREHRVRNLGFVEPGLDDPARNLFFVSYAATCRKHGVEAVPLTLTANNRLPLKAGVGSSATAIIAGVATAHTVHGLSGDYLHLLEDALEFEAHPDNLTACLYGGFTVAILSDQGPLVSKTVIEYPLHLWVLCPDRAVDTKESRRALSQTLTRDDAVFSLSRAALLTAALIKGELGLLYEGMKDRVHEPVRMDPYMEYPTLKARLRGEEFYGWAVIGSGPSVIALCAEVTPRLERLVEEHFAARGVRYVAHKLRVDNQGMVLTDLA